MDNPTKNSPKLRWAQKIEYAKLWMTQSQLFWSRLQTAALLHSAVLAGWYGAKDHPRMRMALLGLGIILSCLLMMLMGRDAHYMEEMRKRADETFPDPEKHHIPGRKCGFAIVIILTLAEVVLLARYFP